MINIYKDSYHERRCWEVMSKLKSVDSNLKSMIYIITGVQNLDLNLSRLYDFYENEIVEDRVTFTARMSSPSEKALLHLAVELLNGSNPQSIVTLLSVLDKEECKLALNAIKIRFDLFETN